MVLLDTNILLDALLDRSPWGHHAARLLSAVDRGELRGTVSVHALATSFYVARKHVGTAAARAAIADLARFLDVAPLGIDHVRYALSVGMSDFEDGLQLAAANLVGADLIVTRDARDFRSSPIPALSAEATLALLASGA